MVRRPVSTSWSVLCHRFRFSNGLVLQMASILRSIIARVLGSDHQFLADGSKVLRPEPDKAWLHFCRNAVSYSHSTTFRILSNARLTHSYPCCITTRVVEGSFDHWRPSQSGTSSAGSNLQYRHEVSHRRPYVINLLFLPLQQSSYPRKMVFSPMNFGKSVNPSLDVLSFATST